MNSLYVLALIVFLVLVYLFFVKKKGSPSSCGCGGGEKNTYLEGMDLHSDEKLLV